jgi:hypothetical protein
MTNLSISPEKKPMMLNLALPLFPFRQSPISTVILGAVIKFQINQPYICFATILVMLVLLTVCRIGNYKFATANRHNAFELFLDYKEHVCLIANETHLLDY